MPKLPKSVISCLRHSQRTPESHPDPNALAAFANRALNRKQRSEVLRHLALCPACRDVVAAVAPERAVVPKRTVWWMAPLGAGLSAALLVGMFWVRQARYSVDQPLQYEKRLSRPAAPASVGVTAEAKAPEPPARHVRHRRPAQQQKPAVAAALPPTSPGYDSGGTPGPEAEALKFAQERSSNRILLRSSAMAAAAPVAADVQLPGPIWSLGNGPNQPNVLLRSTDAGRTWTPFPLDPNEQYTALLSQGTDVWVGTSDAELWHSDDGGTRWTRVRLPLIVRSAITHIRSESPEQVQVTLSSGDVWKSTDGGASWRQSSN